MQVFKFPNKLFNIQLFNFLINWSAYSLNKSHIVQGINRFQNLLQQVLLLFNLNTLFNLGLLSLIQFPSTWTLHYDIFIIELIQYQNKISYKSLLYSYFEIIRMTQYITQFQAEDQTSTSQIITDLLKSINEATCEINRTFQQTILRHEQHFIKIYRIKMVELNNLYEQLKKTLEDKLINNSLMSRLDIILKERDYFKYQCLKLNSQYNSMSEDQKNLTLQLKNINQQSGIYKHLLENEKIRSKETHQTIKQLKEALTTLIQKPPHVPLQPQQQNYLGVYHQQSQTEKLKKEIKEKNEKIRTLKQRLQSSELTISNAYHSNLLNKNLHNIFRCCVQSWKREQITKNRNLRNSQSSMSKISDWSIEQFTTASKKQLLKKLFTSPEFLQFLQDLLFDEECKVTIEKSKGEKFIQSNRKKLYQYLTKKRLFTRQANRFFNPL